MTPLRGKRGNGGVKRRENIKRERKRKTRGEKRGEEKRIEQRRGHKAVRRGHSGHATRSGPTDWSVASPRKPATCTH